jgi:MoxR-like ATPase
MFVPVVATLDLIGKSCVCIRCCKPVREGQTIVAEKIADMTAGWSHIECSAETNAAASEWLKSPRLSDDAIKAITAAIIPGIATAALKSSGPVIEQLIKSEFAIAVEREAKKQRPVYLQLPGKEPVRLGQGVRHSAFNEALAILNQGLNCYLPGPRGCGKTAMAAEIAKVLQVPYYPVSCAGFSGPSDLIGQTFQNLIAGEIEFKPSALLTAFEHGGLVLLDEVDACDPSALIALNAIAESTTSEVLIPRDPHKKPRKRHPDFYLAAAANTVGTGATAEYSARVRQDESLLSRFQFVRMDYDPQIDKAACPDDVVREHFLGYRKQFRELRITQPFPDTRWLGAASRLRQAGASLEWLDKTFFAAMSDNLLARVNPPLQSMWSSAEPPVYAAREPSPVKPVATARRGRGK